MFADVRMEEMSKLFNSQREQKGERGGGRVEMWEALF